MISEFPGAPKELQKKVLEAEEKEEIDLAESLSIRERLMRRLEKQTITVPFEDDLGTFNIEVRILSPAEQGELSKLRTALVALLGKMNRIIPKDGKQIDVDEAVKLNDESQKRLKDLYMFVAKICVDPELDAEYWAKGEGFTMDVPLKLINEASVASQRAQGQTRKFRGQSAGTELL